jgi:release factor glutamine methyltransferase
LNSIQDLYLKGKALLEKAANPPLEAKIILLKCLGLSEESFYSHPNRNVSEAQSLEYINMVSRRAEGMPLAYVIEEKEFWSIPFRIYTGVLIPRPETELLVEKVLELSSKRKELIVDLGTGAGNIALSLAKELPAAEIVATDVSQKALDVAEMNAVRQAERQAAPQKISPIRFEHGSLFEPLDKLRLQKKCDMIVSNPPYVSEREWPSLQDEVRLYEPKEALVAGKTGLEFIRSLVKGAPAFLIPGGYLCLEIGYGQKEEALSLFGDGWSSVRCFEDLNGIPRVITAQLNRPSL